MSDGQVLWTAITGPRCTGRGLVTRLVKKKFESLLPNEHRGWTFIFLHSPLTDLPLPLFHQGTAPEYARVRILEHWAQFYRFVIDQYLPLIERARRGERILALSDGAGHDIAVDATAYTMCTQGKRTAQDLHHELVHFLLVKEEVPKPFYYNVTATGETIMQWMRQKFPELLRVPDEDLLMFIEHQRGVTGDYFEYPVTGQTKHDLNAERFGPEEMAEQVYHHACGLITGEIKMVA